jgi:lysophospholipase L1-like esterase
MPVPPVLVVVPPPIGTPKGPIAAKFAGAAEKCVGLAQAYREVCAALDCAYFDAGTVTPSSRVDGIHLDLDQHQLLGEALASPVENIINAV